MNLRRPHRRARSSSWEGRLGPSAPQRESAVRTVDVFRQRGEGFTRHSDQVAVEAPLEVRLHGHAFSVIMRTPGADRELALGFLFSEGIISGPGDVNGVEETPSVVNVILAGHLADIATDALADRRRVTMNSSCGLCGRRTVGSLAFGAAAFASDWLVDRAVVARLPETLQAAQTAFATTGGLHAAGLFDAGGRLEDSAEDVGRHNAVDKLLGRALGNGRLPLDRSLLCVSGRSSFEIVQKAQMGGIRLVAAVSAPSSLAVDLARDAGITLLGFVRGGGFNLYTHPERLRAVAWPGDAQ